MGQSGYSETVGRVFSYSSRTLSKWIWTSTFCLFSSDKLFYFKSILVNGGEEATHYQGLSLGFRTACEKDGSLKD
jgi:hypothetical protein